MTNDEPRIAPNPDEHLNEIFIRRIAACGGVRPHIPRQGIAGELSGPCTDMERPASSVSQQD